MKLFSLYDVNKNNFNNAYFNELINLKDNKRDTKNNVKNIKEKKIFIKKRFYLNNKNILLLLVILLSFIIILKYSTFNEKQKLSKKIFILKICLCAIGKNENLYIKEYVEHYKKIGYNHIFLYDNNDLDEEKIGDAIPKNEINNGFVSIINFRGKKLAILEAYRDCYEKYNKVYDWLSFYDIDEHLEVKLNNTHTIQKFFNDQRYKICKGRTFQ
jgi:hypothetical protein